MLNIYILYLILKIMLIPSILKGKDMPKHLAITATRKKEWAIKKNKDISEAISLSNSKIKELIDLQIKKDIPIMTIMISTNTSEEIEGARKLFSELAENELVHEKKIRIYAVGNWYDEDGILVDSIKNMMEKTKDYDSYFLNFCVRYDGQEEILTAVKLLLKKAQVDMLKINDLTVEQLKENIPTSNFISPELIIENNNRYSGLMQWDSKGSVIYFSEKFWLDFEKSDFEKALTFFTKLNAEH